MNKTTLSICTTPALLVGSLAVANAQGPAQPRAPFDPFGSPEGRVTICHFPGHEGDEEIGAGQYANEQECIDDEGVVLVITEASAQVGHGIE